MENKIKLLITGASGLLGGITAETALNNGFEVKSFAIRDLNICDRLAVDDVMREFQPQWIINCAAYTKIDASETHREEALRANIHGPQILGELAAAHGAKMIHISTAMVFDGEGHEPYTEEDLTAPACIYGKTKRLGELALLKVLPEAVIVRTSRLYGPYGSNFVNNILKSGINEEEVKSVSDQYSSPTFSGDLAECLLNLIKNDAVGLYHYANQGQCSWYELAQAIFEIARELGITLKLTELKPILGLYYPTQAHRPVYSVLNTAKYAMLPNAKIPFWRESLKYYMKTYLKIEEGQVVSGLD